MTRRRAENLCFVGIWLFLIIAGRTRLLRDPGTLWHTVAGEWMLDHRQVLRTDIFSARHFGEPWIPLQWLSECLMALAYRVGGFDLLLHLSAILIAAFYAWVFGRLRSEGWNWLAGTVLVVLAIWASSYHFHARPHMITIAMIGVTFSWLCDCETGDRNIHHLFWLIPVFVLWVNLHPGVYAGIAVTGFVVVGWSLQWLLGLPSPIEGRLDFSKLVILVATLCLTPLVNPYGWDLPRATFGVLDSPVVRQLIREHVPLDPLDSAYWGVLFLGAVYVSALWKLNWRQPRITWLAPVILFVMALSRVRHGPLFAAAAAIGLGALTRDLDWLRNRVGDPSLQGSLPPNAEKAGSRFSRTVVMVTIGLVVTLQWMGLRIPIIGVGWARLSPSAAPLCTLQPLYEWQKEVPAGTPILNDLNYGGFVIRFAPNLRVFIDDRCELYSDQEYIAYWETISRTPERIEEFAKEVGASAALVKTDGLVDQHLKGSPDWACVKRCPEASFYRKLRWKGGRESEAKISASTTEKIP